MAIDVSTDAGYLRTLAGDVDETNPQVSDAMVARLLTDYGTVAAALVPYVDLMVARAATMVNESSGQERRDAATLADNLRRRRAELVRQGYADPTASSGRKVTRFVRADDATYAELWGNL